jgi:hypothetical protein
MSLEGWRGAFRYGLPGVVLGVVLASWLGGREPSARAQGPAGGPNLSFPLPKAASAAKPGATPPAIETGGTIAFTSPAVGYGQYLYLIDTRARAFAVYRVDPSQPKGAVKLEAARQYQWDLKLSEYNNLPPEVAAIESTVKSLGPPQPSR